MRINRIASIAIIAAGVVLAAGVAAAAGLPGLVTTDVYQNLDGPRGYNVPVTFSRVGGDGDFAQGISPVIDGVAVPAQVDVLRRAPDNSIRHALVSMVLPFVPWGGEMRIEWLNAPPPTPPPFQWGFDPAALTARLVLTTESGESLSSDAGAILGGVWDPSARVQVVRDGPQGQSAMKNSFHHPGRG
jgi:hypothetical protein